MTKKENHVKLKPRLFRHSHADELSILRQAQGERTQQNLTK